MIDAIMQERVRFFRACKLSDLEISMRLGLKVDEIVTVDEPKRGPGRPRKERCPKCGALPCYQERK